MHTGGPATSVGLPSIDIDWNCGLFHDQTYKFSVRAKMDDGTNSASSNTVSVTMR